MTKKDTIEMTNGAVKYNAPVDQVPLYEAAGCVVVSKPEPKKASKKPHKENDDG